MGEHTPYVAEMITVFNDEAAEAFRQKRFVEAVTFYTKTLEECQKHNLAARHLAVIFSNRACAGLRVAVR